MAEKKKTQKNDAQKKDKDKDKSKGKSDGPKKEDTTPNTVVLKVDMHCDGCASKIIRCVRGFQGVETVKADGDAGKLTITGTVDPSKLGHKLAEKTKKKVDVISPQPKKDNKDFKSHNPDHNKNPNDKKSKEPPVTTVVLKVALHCQGCIERIRRTVSKTKGVQELSVDKEKETVTVKGSMDVKALVQTLMERLKRKVEVVPPKKDKEKEKDKDKDKDKEKDTEKEKVGACEKEGGGKGGGKKKGGGDNKKVEEDGGEGGGKLEQSKMEFMAPPFAYGYGCGYGYNYGPVYYMEPVHPPQMFSDENPNACSLM